MIDQESERVMADPMTGLSLQSYWCFSDSLFSFLALSSSAQMIKCCVERFPIISTTQIKLVFFYFFLSLWYHRGILSDMEKLLAFVFGSILLFFITYCWGIFSGVFICICNWQADSFYHSLLKNVLVVCICNLFLYLLSWFFITHCWRTPGSWVGQVPLQVLLCHLIIMIMVMLMLMLMMLMLMIHGR